MQPSQPAAATNPFGQPQQHQQTQPQEGASQNPTASGTATPDPSTYLRLSQNNQPTAFKNQPVTYLPDPKNFHVYQNAAANNQPEHLWFPAGPPVANADTQLEDVYYEGELGTELRAIYESVASTGAFGAMGMPEVPPRREWVRFDL